MLHGTFYFQVLSSITVVKDIIQFLLIFLPLQLGSPNFVTFLTYYTGCNLTA